jgi:hypothetical protein
MNDHGNETGRRGFLGAALGVVGGELLGVLPAASGSGITSAIAANGTATSPAANAVSG